MKIKQKGSKLIRPETKTTQKFEIKDSAMVIDILRDKLYSNKIRVICQEYMCNGRDAHREIDSEEAITVKLPSTLKPQIEFRDFGPGITPERMSTVFCYFGESTKRGSNRDTGGFGIGAKSAWSYSEQFGVMTYIDGILRHYSMSIDETRHGEMILIHTEETNEPNGTKIIIPVKSRDLITFEEWVYRTSQWWDVKPNIIGQCGYKGSYFEWKNDDKIVFQEKNKWTIVNSYTTSTKPIAVVDGIEYPINIDNLKDFDDQSLQILKNKIYIYFNTGEVEVAVNREQLDYINKTQSAIRTRCKNALNCILKDIQERVVKCKDFRSAFTLWSDLDHNIKKLLKTVEWKSPDNKLIKLSTYLKIDNNNYSIVNIRTHNNDTSDIRKNNIAVGGNGSHYLPTNENVVIAINDSEKTPSIPRMHTLFEKYGSDKTIHCINIPKKVDESDEDHNKRVDEFIQGSILKYMNCERTSLVEKKQKPNLPKSPSNKATTVKYNVYHIATNSKQKSYPKKQIDLQTAEGYYFDFEYNFVIIGSKRVPIGQASVYFYKVLELLGIDIRDPKQSVFAIPIRFKNKMPSNSKLKSINKLLTKKIYELAASTNCTPSDLYFMHKNMSSRNRSSWSYFWSKNIYNYIIENVDQFEDKENLLLTHALEVKNITDIVNSVGTFLEPYNSSLPPKIVVDLNKTKDEVENIFSLLILFSEYNSYYVPSNIIKTTGPEMIKYANIMYNQHKKMNKTVSLATA